MSVQRRCDICDSNPAVWNFRKRWRIFKQVWDEEMDMCDKCLTEFKNFVNLKRKGV